MKRNKKELQPNWRPNFVNPAALPDIKVVRTNFMVNSLAMVMALGMVFLVAQREYQARSLESSIASLESRIDRAEAEDEKYLRLSGEFKEAAEYIVEVAQFTEIPFLPHDFVKVLASIKPDDLIYRSITISEAITVEGKNKLLTYRINLNGDARSLTVLDEFKGILAAEEALQIRGYRVEIDETLEGRDEQTGIFPYRMSVSFIPDASKGSKGKDAS
jgi:hypothetical protein